MSDKVTVRKILIEVARGLVEENLPLSDILDDLELEDTIDASERDAIDEAQGKDQLKKLCDFLKKKSDLPLAYSTFRKQLMNHTRDSYDKIVKPIEDKHNYNKVQLTRDEHAELTHKPAYAEKQAASPPSSTPAQPGTHTPTVSSLAKTKPALKPKPLVKAKPALKVKPLTPLKPILKPKPLIPSKIKGQPTFIPAQLKVPATDPDSYYRVYKALHLVAHEAIPCVDRCLSTWHANQALPSCTGQCPIGKKPKPPVSCQNCLAWCQAVEGALYNQPPKVRLQVTWSNVNSSGLGKTYLEVAKAFVLRLPHKQTSAGASSTCNQYNSMSDFDSASLLMIMAKFAGFHNGTKASYDTIMKVAGIRNELSHMTLQEDMQIDDQKVKQYFQEIKT
ncbi:uncharacterized protein [Amphiura filiformis]|uniref:uncharacterized protein n=1 Tax=Amphiura filiformis TaxID=82378 RepID=UPI003B215748